ncbi:DinB family protein [Branchiibius sp. NY16-3462-2]|uniref:DinB family protein n=1 Tax=Branchiibius sp. NY16-3462-2 TaxID=1807500 RepID=UPI000796CCAC|nr:DinB family protein [Branchiibius sp. NY16-3462-2]KYH46203.1 methyltransferase type 12 [Branchiibius sp. NY16-3462-2]
MTSIEPDTKDWTWVLEKACPDCEFDPTQIDFATIADQVRSMTPRWQDRLARPDATTRPEPTVWSPTEYAAHVRDVHRVFDERFEQLLTEDDPLFANWDQDAAAIDGDYASLSPDAVSIELATATEQIASRLDTITADQLDRPGRRSNGSIFTVDTLARYYLHDLVHHLHDVDA